MSNLTTIHFMLLATLGAFIHVADLKVSYNYRHYNPTGKGLQRHSPTYSTNEAITIPPTRNSHHSRAGVSSVAANFYSR